MQAWNVADGYLTLSLDLSQAQPVGCGNVSGAFIPGLTIDTPYFSALFQLHAGTPVTDQNGVVIDAGLTSPLYAPVLVNHYIGPTP